MAKQKVYVQKSYVFELEIDTDLINPEEFIKKYHNTLNIDNDTEPASIQYMVEDSEWVEIHN